MAGDATEYFTGSAAAGRGSFMSQRSSSIKMGVGWTDVFAILVVIAILAAALGEIATGRIRDFSRPRTPADVSASTQEAPAPEEASS